MIKKLWKHPVDYKYNVDKGNIFTCREHGYFNFWKGVILPAKVAKLGYRWKVGKWDKIMF
jgi:hypothetical protein